MCIRDSATPVLLVPDNTWTHGTADLTGISIDPQLVSTGTRAQLVHAGIKTIGKLQYPGGLEIGVALIGEIAPGCIGCLVDADRRRGRVDRPAHHAMDTAAHHVFHATIRVAVHHVLHDLSLIHI